MMEKSKGSDNKYKPRVRIKGIRLGVVEILALKWVRVGVPDQVW